MSSVKSKKGGIQAILTADDREFVKGLKTALNVIEKLDKTIKRISGKTKKFMNTKIKITNKTEVETKMKGVKGRVRDSLAVAVYMAGVRIMKESSGMVPVDTGRLRMTRYVTLPIGKQYRVEIGYGTPYGFYQHQHHRQYSRYLQRPLQAYTPSATAYAVRDIKNAFKGKYTVRSLSLGVNTRSEDPGRDWQISRSYWRYE